MPRAPPVTMATLSFSLTAPSSPAGVAAVRKHDASGQEARRIGREKQHHGADLIHLAHAVHRRALDPVLEHLGVLHAEAVEGRVDIGWSHGVDPHAASGPF